MKSIIGTVETGIMTKDIAILIECSAKVDILERLNSLLFNEGCAEVLRKINS